MNLLECSCQPNETLEEHFQNLNRKYVNGQGTLALIERLREFPDERTVYGLTSVDRLCLLSQDDYTTPWWVVITSHGIDDFRIECRLPQEQAPWRGAQILGRTKDLGKAVEMVVKGLILSRGWNTEIGDRPIGLDEIIEDSLSLFRLPGAEEACRGLLRGWENQIKVCPATEEEVLVTVLARTSEKEALGYRHDAAETSSRWGLIEPESQRLPSPDFWFYWMDDAFCASAAWDGPAPPKLG
ncbi:MAG TPA: hypothetical protein EYO33_18885 [Phycisphaerales bacterium]|nr:hypothetical protein [Phycisphaerales bacterium]